MVFWGIGGSGKSANMPWWGGAIQQASPTPPIARFLHPGIQLVPGFFTHLFMSEVEIPIGLRWRHVG
jgi:hypothetical protein